MNEFVSQFLLEAHELTEQATQDLLALEQAPADRHHLDSAFRALHTLKGAAAIMEYAPMERLLHRAEDRLQELRRESATVSADIIDACLACIGQVVRWLDPIAREGGLPDDAEQSALHVARQLEAPSYRPSGVSHAWVDDLRQWAGPAAAGGVAVCYTPGIDAFFKGLDPIAIVGGLPGLSALRFAPRSPWPALQEMQAFDCNLTIEAVSTASRVDVEKALRPILADTQIADITGEEAPVVDHGPDDLARLIVDAQIAFVKIERPAESFAGNVGSAGRTVANILEALGRTGAAKAVEAATLRATAERDADVFLRAAAEGLRSLQTPAQSPPFADIPERNRETVSSAIRVDVAKVNAIVDLTGELLVIKNALVHVTGMAVAGADPATLGATLRAHTARLERHVSDLQRAVLDLRVLPMSRTFSRFPVLIRETAARLGKQVAFRSEGDDTMADKAVVEALFEPLLHVVRNAIDHGIESSATRLAAGKNATAVIVMRSWRQGEHVVVEVSDDGRGVDTSVVRQLAISRGVVNAEAAASLSEQAAVDLIFAPGFTTAEQVTDLSGRGVGMNAVRSAVARMGGDVALTNAPSKGLSVRITLPFTVMMTRVMTVETGGQIFGLPFDAVLETIRVPRTQIKAFGSGQAIVLRDVTVPVIDLAASLELDVEQAARSDIACLVIASVGGQHVGVEVERLGAPLELMLKPVEGFLSNMKAISGTSLLGDGRVLIVLDLGALIE